VRKLNLYTFHRNIQSFRFDAHNTKNLIDKLSKKYDVTWHNKDGQDKFHYINDCDVLIDQGSFLIFEFDDSKEFKTFDFGDSPNLTAELSKSSKFIGAAIGQYNKKLWDDLIKNPIIRKNIKSAIYPETCWNFGIENFAQIEDYRKSVDLDNRLYWRGSTYTNHPDPKYRGVRESIEYIHKILPEFYFGNYPIGFDQYIQEAINFKLILGFGGGGGYLCGDFCFRDIEMFGLGIPIIRPQFAAETLDPLIPDYHYISVDCEFDDVFRYKNHEKLAHDVVAKYKEVINNDDLLLQVANNARNWYIKNISSENVTNKIIESLCL
jgi:hypothetical protein